MLLGNNQVVIQCDAACKAPRPHQLTVERLPEGRDETTLTCLGCQARQVRILTHFRAGKQASACGLLLDRTRRKWTESTAKVTCPECVVMLVTELSKPPEIDWRPSESIPEDHYAT